MKIDLILKVFFINIFTYICTFRIMNKKANLIFVSVFSILNTIIHVILKSYISNIYLIIISYFIAFRYKIAHKKRIIFCQANYDSLF